MKTIQQFIKEALNNDIIALISKNNLNITPTTLGKSKAERLKNGKKQEEEVIKQLGDLLKDYEVVSIKKYAEITNQTYSSEFDSKNGDIVILKDNNAILFIDLKVGSEKYIGTPDALSLYNFAMNNGDLHYYLMSKNDGSYKVFVNAKKLFDKFKNEPTLIASKTSRNKKIDFGFNVNVKIWSGALKQEDKSVYDGDFIPTNFIYKLS